MKIKRKTINATEFKAKCLDILDHLDKNGVVVSKRGKPIALVFPYAGIETKKLIGSMRGKIKIKGNILSTGVKWNAKSRYAHDRTRPEWRTEQSGRAKSRK